MTVRYGPPYGPPCVPSDELPLFLRETVQMTPEDIERHKDYFDNYGIKPCPFCGCEMECRLMHDTETYGFPMRYFIVGDHKWDCFLEHVPMVPYDDKENAISTWNRRVKE